MKLKKEKRIRALYVAPYVEPKVVEIENELHTLQSFVEGYIEILPLTDEVAIICNEEGKLNQMPLNRSIRGKNGEIFEIIAGSFLIVGDDLETGEFRSLTAEEADRYYKQFRFPEVFMMAGDDIKAIPIPEMFADIEEII